MHLLVLEARDTNHFTIAGTLRFWNETFLALLKIHLKMRNFDGSTPCYQLS
jgi:hypothetical protein